MRPFEGTEIVKLSVRAGGNDSGFPHIPQELVGDQVDGSEAVCVHGSNPDVEAFEGVYKGRSGVTGCSRR